MCRASLLAQSTVTVTLLLLLVVVPSLVAAYLHTRALLERMRGFSTKVSRRRSSAMTRGCRAMPTALAVRA